MEIFRPPPTHLKSSSVLHNQLCDELCIVNVTGLCQGNSANFINISKIYTIVYYKCIICDKICIDLIIFWSINNSENNG